MKGCKVWLIPALSIVFVTCPLGCLISRAFAQTDPHVGTWDLNLEKSTFTPGPPPRKQTLWYKAEGQGLTALLQGVDAAGRPISPDSSNFVINFDGRDHPTPHANYDSSVWSRINANTYVVTRKRGGKVILTSTNVVSADGRTMTITTAGEGDDGRPIHNVRVYIKR